MERKVARASGERSQDETKRLQIEIQEAQVALDNQKQQLQMLTISNKQLEDEKRNIERTINKVRDQKQTLEIQIQEMRLENEMANSDVAKV